MPAIEAMSWNNAVVGRSEWADDSVSLGISPRATVLLFLTTLWFRDIFSLLRNLASEALDAMYQRTGAPLHAAYALPQLLDFYENAPEQECRRVHRWQTISSICLHRWMGGGKIQMPISYSEAR